MEHWNKFKSDNGTIEFADMEQWNESLNQVENDIRSFKSKNKTALLDYIINGLVKLYNKLQSKIIYSFVKLDNINKLNDVINDVYNETKKYYEKRKDTDRNELLGRAKKLHSEMDIFYITGGIHFEIENILHYISNYFNSSRAKYIENKINELSEHIIETHSNNSYDEFCNIIKKWIYIVDLITKKHICDLDKIKEYDMKLYEKYGKSETALWLNELQKLSCCDIDIIMTNDFISNLIKLNDWLYKGIANKTIDGTYINCMFDFLLYLYNYVFENSNSDCNIKVISEVDKLISYCLHSNYNDIEISCENIQLNEWKETLSFHLYPKEKYSMFDFNLYRYIDMLKANISLSTLKSNTDFINSYNSLNLNELIAYLEDFYKKDNPESKTSIESFVNNDSKKTISILNILLDKNIDFIKHKGRYYQFNQISVETLNFLLSKPFYNDEYDKNKDDVKDYDSIDDMGENNYSDNDDELIERFKNELRKGNIKSFDSALSKENYLFKDVFLPKIHSLIADLYDVNTNCNFSDINTTLTYELLTHKVYNKLITEFDLLYDDISNNHSSNMASVYVTRIIQDRFSPILSMAKEIPPFFIIPDKPKDVEITYDTIKSALIGIKKPYNIDLIKNDSVMMKYFQRLTNNIIDLRKLLNLTITKGTA